MNGSKRLEKKFPNLLETLERASKELRDLPEIKKQDTHVWRYLTFPKLVSILQKKALFFPSMRFLRQSDPAEGKYRTKLEWSREGIWHQIAGGFGSATQMQEEAHREVLVGMAYYVSSWYQGDQSENYAMWKLYGQDGIAILSTIEKLDTAVVSPFSSIKKLSKPVVYQIPDDMEPETFIFHKRPAYRSEAEYRVVLNCVKTLFDEGKDGDSIREQLLNFDGLYVPVDPEKLISKIVTPPNVSPWLEDLTRGLLEKFDVQIDVVKSTIEI